MRSFVFTALIVLLVAACRQSQQAATNIADDNIQIELATEPNPPTIGEGILLITVQNADGGMVNIERVEVRGDMNHAGMQPVFSSADTPENGIYNLPFNWTMGGDWFLTVTATLEDGTTATRRFDFSVGME
jgi:hypothetical protein